MNLNGEEIVESEVIISNNFIFEEELHFEIKLENTGVYKMLKQSPISVNYFF